MSNRFEYDLNNRFNYQGEIPTLLGMFNGKCTILIPENSSVSQTFDFSFCKSLAILIPENFDGTTLFFYGSAIDTDDVADMVPCYDGSGNLITLTVDTDRWICPSMDEIKGIMTMRFLKIASGTSPAALTTQTALRSLILQAKA